MDLVTQNHEPMFLRKPWHRKDLLEELDVELAGQ
jgi:hypothetical protein